MIRFDALRLMASGQVGGVEIYLSRAGGRTVGGLPTGKIDKTDNFKKVKKEYIKISRTRVTQNTCITYLIYPEATTYNIVPIRKIQGLLSYLSGSQHLRKEAIRD